MQTHPDMVLLAEDVRAKRWSLNDIVREVSDVVQKRAEKGKNFGTIVVSASERGLRRIVGVGVLVMHYVGMAGLELCRAIYTAPGIAVSSFLAIALCILAFWVAYGQRTNRNILLGTLCFAVAVCAVHFLAMAGTSFVEAPGLTEFGPSMSNETLALGVIFFSFVIFGACLWVSVTYLVAAPTPHPEEAGKARFDWSSLQ